jgi:hypothetical protein
MVWIRNLIWIQNRNLFKAETGTRTGINSFGSITLPKSPDRVQTYNSLDFFICIDPRRNQI